MLRNMSHVTKNCFSNINHVTKNCFSSVVKPHPSEFIQDVGPFFGIISFGGLGFLGACELDDKILRPNNVPRQVRAETFVGRFQNNLITCSSAIGLYGGMVGSSMYVGRHLGSRPFIDVPVIVIAGSALFAAPI